MLGDIYLKVIVITVPFIACGLNTEEVPEVNSDKVPIVGAYCPAIFALVTFLRFTHILKLENYIELADLQLENNISRSQKDVPLFIMSHTFLDCIPSPEALNSCWVVERVSWGEEYVVLSVAHCEVPAVLLLQPRVHALLGGRGGIEVEGDGEQEEEVEEVEGHHHQEFPLCPHFHREHPLQRPSLLTFHISLMVLHMGRSLNFGKQV